MARNLLLRLGIWVWGGITALLGLLIVVVIVLGEPALLYGRITAAATALGAVVAASALAWSHFFQTGSRRDEASKLEELSLKIDALSVKVDGLLKEISKPTSSRHEEVPTAIGEGAPAPHP